MIKINLLSEGRKPVTARKKVSTGGGFDLRGVDAGSLALLGAVVLALIVALGHNFLLGRSQKKIETQVAEAFQGEDVPVAWSDDGKHWARASISVPSARSGLRSAWSSSRASSIRSCRIGIQARRTWPRLRTLLT